MEKLTVLLDRIDNPKPIELVSFLLVLLILYIILELIMRKRKII